MPEQQVFPPEVLEEIYKRSRGIPRFVNLICDNLLVTAFAMEQKVTTLKMLDEVSHDLRLDWPGARGRRGQSRYGMSEDQSFPEELPITGD